MLLGSQINENSMPFTKISPLAPQILQRKMKFDEGFEIGKLNMELRREKDRAMWVIFLSLYLSLCVCGL